MTTESIVHELFRRLDLRDPEKVAELFAAEVHWFIPGPAHRPWTGVRTRREQIPEYFRILWANFVDSAVEPGDMIVSGGQAAIFGRFSHTAVPTGKRFSHFFAMHLKIADGRINHLQVYDDTDAVERAFTRD